VDEKWVPYDNVHNSPKDPTLKQILLATALIALPVAAFTTYQLFAAPTAVATSAISNPDVLGDMASFLTITADVQTITATGDFTAAENRITDLESAWDDAASRLRAVDANAWSNVDQSIDAALDALRSSAPDAGTVTTTLATLVTSLGDPSIAPGDAGTCAVTLVSGIAVTDDAGRALPCEVMLSALSDKLAAVTLSDSEKAAVADLQTRALERCNADDDARADGFSAEALALLAAR
jgi:dihydroxyacetone kinase